MVAQREGERVNEIKDPIEKGDLILQLNLSNRRPKSITADFLNGHIDKKRVYLRYNSPIE